MQHLQVMADCRLGQLETVRQIANTRLTASMGSHDRQQPQPDRVRQSLQQRCDLLSLPRAQRLTRQRGTTRNRLHRAQHRTIVRHTSIFTQVDLARQAQPYRLHELPVNMTAAASEARSPQHAAETHRTGRYQRRRPRDYPARTASFDLSPQSRYEVSLAQGDVVEQHCVPVHGRRSEC